MQHNAWFSCAADGGMDAGARAAQEQLPVVQSILGQPPGFGLMYEYKSNSYRLLNSVKIKAFCEPPSADSHAVVWGELERDQLLPDYIASALLS